MTLKKRSKESTPPNTNSAMSAEEALSFLKDTVIMGLDDDTCRRDSLKRETAAIQPREH